MRLESLRIKGLGPFKDELAIDFADYAGAKLIAITGDNGAGKTTMLELALPGAMFRSTPTRGSLTELATARDAMLEVRVVNGQPWTLRHLIDGVSGKSEALVMDGEGRPAVDSGKVRHFDAWAAKHLPAPEVLFTSCFGSQGGEGFVGLKPGERKAVLLRTLGVERYEGLAEGARERAKALKLKVETLEARMVDERARQTGNADTMLAEFAARVPAAEARLNAARAALAEAEAEVRRLAELDRAAKEARARRTELDGQLARERLKLEDLDKRIANNRAVLSDAVAIREAEALVPARVQQMEALRRELTELRASYAGVEADIAATRRLIEAGKRERASAEQRSNAARVRLANEKQIREAKGLVPQRLKLVEQVTAELAAAEAELAALHELRIAGTDERLTHLRRGLTLITKLGDDEDIRTADTIAVNHLETDDEAQRTARETPAKVTSADQRVRSARERLAVAERQLREVEQLAAREPELAADRAELTAAGEAWEQASAGIALDAEREDVLLRSLDPITMKIAQRKALLAEKEADQPRLVELASAAEPLAKAETRLSELEPQRAQVVAELERLEAEVSATPAHPVPPDAPDVAAYRKVVEDCERALREASAAVAVAQQRAADEQASVERLRVLEGERAGLDDELADWTRLAADLGRDGLQAMVIDAAIPELNEVANSLLHEAFGPRWTIDVRTQAIDAKGKRLLETLDVVVIDTEAGREGLAETLSGGERVIVQEALSLALTVLACRQSGVERPTLVRDESGAALAEGRAPQWIAMLRRAVDLIGADKCLFVSHTPATWELADARIHLGGSV
jgi:exonuclease SbcC